MNIPGYNPIFRAVLRDGGAERLEVRVKSKHPTGWTHSQILGMSSLSSWVHCQFITDSLGIHRRAAYFRIQKDKRERHFEGKGQTWVVPDTETAWWVYLRRVAAVSWQTSGGPTA
jgi:hypothetical protein